MFEASFAEKEEGLQKLNLASKTIKFSAANSLPLLLDEHSPAAHSSVNFIWRGTHSRANAFLKCDNLEMLRTPLAQVFGSNPSNRWVGGSRNSLKEKRLPR